MTDLNSLADRDDAGRLLSANDIDDTGRITGHASGQDEGRLVAFRATPRR